MSFGRVQSSFTERRRRRLAFRRELERMEPRSTVTPIGLAAFAAGIAPAAASSEPWMETAGTMLTLRPRLRTRRCPARCHPNKLTPHRST